MVFILLFLSLKPERDILALAAGLEFRDWLGSAMPGAYIEALEDPQINNKLSKS